MKEWCRDDYEECLEEGKVLLKVGAEFCKPCKELEGKLEAVEADYPYQFAAIDVEEIAAEIATLEVSELPTTIFFVDGEEQGRFEGCLDNGTLQEYLSSWASL